MCLDELDDDNVNFAINFIYFIILSMLNQQIT